MIAAVEKDVTFAPRLVLVHPDPAYVAQVCRQFRCHGWQVQLASCGAEARRLARLLAPAAVVLATQGRDESGWLTCAKLISELPTQKVILVGTDREAEAERFAQFVGGAALVSQEGGPGALFEEVSAPPSVQTVVR